MFAQKNPARPLLIGRTTGVLITHTANIATASEVVDLEWATVYELDCPEEEGIEEHNIHLTWVRGFYLRLFIFMIYLRCIDRFIQNCKI